MTNFLEMSAFHAAEKTHFISITAGILCPIFQISVLPAPQILCQSSALKNLCQPRYIIPPTSSPALLMWQNKPRPIRIKALKRSLKPLKVRLNRGMTIWAVGQQMLNGVIASPPQRALLRCHTAHKPARARAPARAHTHTTHCSRPLPKAPQPSFTVYVLCSPMQVSVQHFSFFVCFDVFCCELSGQSLALLPFAASELRPRMKTRQTLQCCEFSSLMIYFCKGESHVKGIVRGRML